MAFTALTNDYNKAVALMLQDKNAYSVNMYIEFDASPAPPAQVVVEATTDHNGYYSDTVGVDYLRVSVAQYPFISDSGHEGYTDNQITFTGYTSSGDGVGERGTSIVGDQVYGAAIAVANKSPLVTSADTPATDIIIARAYFDAADWTTVTASKGAVVQMILALTNSDAVLESSSGSSS